MFKNKLPILKEIAFRAFLFTTILSFALLFCSCNNKVVTISNVETNANQKSMTAQQTIPLPDTKQGLSGTGFTCTGLTYSQKNDSFYVGNFGAALPSNDEHFPSIVQLSKDCSSIISEITLDKFLTETSSIQGVAYDISNDSLWLADFSNNSIYNITSNGELLNRLNYINPNGVAYDSRTDTLWVINNSSNNGDIIIKNIKKSGEEILTFNISGIYHSDQLYLDEQNDSLYFSAGADYHGENYIYLLSLANRRCSQKYVLGDSYAIEGICIVDGKLFVCNDGFYHNSYSNTNEMKVYNIAN